MKMFETWVIFAFVSLLGYTLVNLLYKPISKENPLLMAFIIYGSATIIILILLFIQGNFSISSKSTAIAIIIGLSSAFATIFAIKSINLAPNPGYSVAIYSASFVFIAVASVFLFSSTLTIKKVIGILATLIGLILLSI